MEKELYKVLYEDPDRSLFYRKAKCLGRFYEICDLPEYTGTLLYPSGGVNMPHYMDAIPFGYNQEGKEIRALILQEFMQEYSSVPKAHTVAGDMFTHSIANYERVLGEGFASYLPRIEKITDRDIREGLTCLLRGIETYVARMIAYLQQVGADEKLIAALQQVPMQPARDIYEAVLAWNFVMYLDCCDNLGCVAAGLYPYYKGENIVPLLENLFDNLDRNGGYSMALSMDYNPLTLQCLEASKGRRRPMIELFVDETTPEEIWEKAFEVIRTYNGQPAFYNPYVLLNGLRKRFPNVTDADIKKFCGGGCTEAMLAGLSNVGSVDAGINLLLILEECMQTKLVGCHSFDAFYDCYISAVNDVVNKVTREISASQKRRKDANPLPMRTLLVDDCIDRGVDFNNGGARYQWSIVSFAGMINVIDALLVIKSFVYEKGLYTAEELLARLQENDGAFLQQARNNDVAFGRDDAAANALAHKLSSQVFSMLDGKKTYFGEGFIPASIQFMSQVEGGKPVGATPDGREKGTPLCDSLGAIFGKDTKGPTALLNSVASLDLKQALGVPVLNFNINPDFKDDVLKALILGYMQQGGIQMQLTCISAAVLEEAYRNPEMHKNLVVRVGGYSEYFYRLSDELKRMVINRTIQSGV